MSMLSVAAVFLLGVVFGSFLNVCIYRLPRRESIAWPRSHCPVCRTPILNFDKIPVLSFILLRGKCRHCKTPISITYPLVELLTGILLVAVWWQFGPGLSFLHYSVLVLFLLPISFIDLDTKLILNVLTIPGMVAGMALSFFVNGITPWQAGLGLLLGGGLLLAIGLVGQYLFKQESMGGGDVKLGAMIGAFMGPEVLVALFLAFVLALPVIAIGLSTGRLRFGSKLPFGPFISAAAVILVFYGQTLYTYYFRLLG